MLVLEQAVYINSVDFIRRLFRDINANLLRKFSRLFKRDENGRQRNWKEVENEQVIRDHWLNCKNQVEELIKEFKFIKIPKYPITQSQLSTSKSRSHSKELLQEESTLLFIGKL